MNDVSDLVDLAAERVGGAVMYANDEFFAPKENLLRASEPVFREHEYTDRGKWMDGWESRRRRTPGHDFCIVRLGLRGILRMVDVDTRFFRGNYPDECSIEGAFVPGNPTAEALLAEDVEWTEILPRKKLAGDTHNLFPIAVAHPLSHLRLNIFPDGGVARLRVYGDVAPDWKWLTRGGQWVDLAAIENGGRVIACNDMFFGSRHNLIMPGRAATMGDGWETKRKRGPGNDWVVVRLGARGTVMRVEVDTNHFKGNYPDAFVLRGCDATEASMDALIHPTHAWKEIIPHTKLMAHTRHFYQDEVRDAGPVSHVRLDIFPDGGVSRLRLFGRVEQP